MYGRETTWLIMIKYSSYYDKTMDEGEREALWNDKGSGDHDTN